MVGGFYERGKGMAILEVRPNRLFKALNSQQAPLLINVSEIRKRTGLTQSEFGALYGFSVETVRAWEQNKHPPGKIARNYLLVIANDPQRVAEVVNRWF